jgi:hypothetical protein
MVVAGILVTNQKLLKKGRIFRAKPPSPQRKSKSSGFKTQDVKVFFAFFAALRETLLASTFLIPACPG